MTCDLVKNYVDEALAQQRRLGLMMSPGHLPDAMVDPSIPPSQDWIGWKPVPSTVTDSDLDELEQATGLTLPPLYRDFLKYLHFVEISCGIRFESHMCHNWRETIPVSRFTEHARDILQEGLLPFGDEARLDAGPVCFDTRHRLPNGDCPVVFWDHEWVDTDMKIQPLFSSAEKMFECLTLIARSDYSIFYHDKDEDPSLIPQKIALLNQFHALDPEGAGGPARSYWSFTDLTRPSVERRKPLWRVW